jgi:hypothetical protein
MLNRKIRNVAVATAFIMSAVGVAVAASGAPAQASGTSSLQRTARAVAGPGSEYLVLPDGGPAGLQYSVHAHAHNYPLNLQTTAVQKWTFNYGISTPGAPEPYKWELQLAGTKECANYVLSNQEFFLDNCVSNDANEYFWVVPTGGISPLGYPQYWLINEGATDENWTGAGGYYYMTDDQEPTGFFGAETEGWGMLAVWALPCIADC